MNAQPPDSYVLLSDYVDKVAPTDKIDKTDITSLLFGLFSEVGSVMSALKKRRREGDAFIGYQRSLEEELGDTLWYLSALCRRLEVSLPDLFQEALSKPGFKKCIAAGTTPLHPFAEVISAEQIPLPNPVLLRLGEQTAQLLYLSNNRKNARITILNFIDSYLEAILVSGISFAAILRSNIAKVRGRFLQLDPTELPDFDKDFPEDEQLPREFEIEIFQRPNGRSYLRWNGVFVGDPLTDNIAEPDGYRFHDVFHLAYAAILHWSPTFRGLIKHKRKSDAKLDEAQDSGRAIVIDEGVSALIFAHAKLLDFFEGQGTVSFDLLKSVSNFVQGYEVEKCPLSLWETAILQGYEVFRQVRQHNGGIVIGNRNQRTLEFKNP